LQSHRPAFAPGDLFDVPARGVGSKSMQVKHAVDISLRAPLRTPADCAWIRERALDPSARAGSRISELAQRNVQSVSSRDINNA
jgi:hypothetical protein